jgi:hypothetical protein
LVVHRYEDATIVHPFCGNLNPVSCISSTFHLLGDLKAYKWSGYSHMHFVRFELSLIGDLFSPPLPKSSVTRGILFFSSLGCINVRTVLSNKCNMIELWTDDFSRNVYSLLVEVGVWNCHQVGRQAQVIKFKWSRMIYFWLWCWELPIDQWYWYSRKFQFDIVGIHLACSTYKLAIDLDHYYKLIY